MKNNKVGCQNIVVVLTTSSEENEKQIEDYFITQYKPSKPFRSLLSTALCYLTMNKTIKMARKVPTQYHVCRCKLFFQVETH